MKKNINAFLNLGLSFQWFSQKKVFFIWPVVGILATLTIGLFFFSGVSLKPNIGSNFFFSSDDPQMQDEQKIQQLFKQDPQLILSIKGNIQSALYHERIKKITEEILALEDVIGAQSLTHGPKNFEDALNGPLWSRVIVSKDQKSTLVPVFVEQEVAEDFIVRFEELVEAHRKPDFEILISGAPYIVELLRRSLFQDIKIFSLMAFLFFGFLFIFFFRSWRVLFATLTTCAISSMLTLMSAQALGIEMGMLTANLSTIVFVLTLSHIIFILFNWNEIDQQNTLENESYIYQSLQKTLPGSFWSMLTTFLGFLSLLWVKATPLKQLGYAGSLGTVMSFLCAYIFFAMMFPVVEKGLREKNIATEQSKIKLFFVKKHGFLVLFLFLMAVIAGFGIPRINTDPSLLDYFKEGSELKKGLQYIDQTGGSSPLFIAVQNRDKSSFSKKEAYEMLLKTTRELEKDGAVGSAVSLPIIIQQAEERFIARLLSMDWLIGILSTERFGKVAQYFITPENREALIMLRMKESERIGPRVAVLDRLRNVVTSNQLEPFLIGGVYSLQGRMSELVKSSMISGLSFLLILFFIMAWALSTSFITALSVLISLLAIPILVLGILGFLKIPLDIISAPAINISIGMAVDAMVHMMIYMRRFEKDRKNSWAVWKNTLSHYWMPVFYTAIIVGGGFGIFGLSSFPPTQRFGMMVLMGAVMSPCVALVVFPYLATLLQKSKKKD